MIGLRQKWYYVNYYLPLQQVKKIIHPPPPQKKSEKSWKNYCIHNYLFIYNFMVGEGEFDPYISLMKIKWSVS